MNQNLVPVVQILINWGLLFDCFHRWTPVPFSMDIIPGILVYTSDFDRVFCWSLHKTWSCEIFPFIGRTLVIVVWGMDGCCCCSHWVSISLPDSWLLPF